MITEPKTLLNVFRASLLFVRCQAVFVIAALSLTVSPVVTGCFLLGRLMVTAATAAAAFGRSASSSSLVCGAVVFGAPTGREERKERACNNGS